MSRVFTLTTDEIAIPASAMFDEYTAITLAAWVYVTDFGSSGIPVLVKDPNSYQTNLYINPDGTLSAGAGGQDPVSGAEEIDVVDGGTGYAFNDLGTLDGGSPDAVYHVFGETGGVATDVGLDSFGEGYTLGQICTTTPTSGGGSGLELEVTKLRSKIAFSQSNETLNLNEWTHVAMTWNTATGTVKLYINGVECTYSSQTISTGIDDTTDGYFIGNDTFGEDGQGRIAEAVIYDVLLNDAAVLALAESTDGATGSPIGYWHLCGDDSPEPDSSGNGNDGVLSSPAPAQGPDSPGFSCATAPTEITEVVVNADNPIERNSPFSVVVAIDAPATQDTEIELTFTGTGSAIGTLTGTILSGETEVTIPDITIDSAGTGDTFTAEAISGDVVTGADSAPFDVTDSAEATHDTVGIGEFGGNTLAEAFYNPQHMDLIQVINEGGDVVWNLTFDGDTNFNPVSSTRKALVGSYFGESFALAFPNPYSKDVFQVIGQGDNVVFWIDANGESHTA